jgi:hypothetical protein
MTINIHLDLRAGCRHIQNGAVNMGRWVMRNKMEAAGYTLAGILAVGAIATGIIFAPVAVAGGSLGALIGGSLGGGAVGFGVISCVSHVKKNQLERAHIVTRKAIAERDRARRWNYRWLATSVAGTVGGIVLGSRGIGGFGSGLGVGVIGTLVTAGIYKVCHR